MKYAFRLSAIGAICISLSLSSSFSFAAQPNIKRHASSAADDRFIIIWDKGHSKKKTAALRTNKASFTKLRKLKQLRRVDILKKPDHLSLKEAMQEAKKLPGVMAVEPDFTVHAISTTPNDPDFSQLWGLDGNANDINGPEAWDISTGDNNAVIAVIDSGINYNHIDLAANVWNNPNEIANNNIDDDGNGWVDDIHGIDTYNNDSDPLDDNGHGTHVSGTIAAVGNNGIGISGVAWQAKIINCKFLSASGSGLTSGAISCLDYLLDLKVNQGINLIATNNSWGGGGFSEALYAAISDHRDNDILFVAAAGNYSADNDTSAHYPSNYDLSNIISVAALDEYGQLASFSNFGLSSVDLAAPGSNIYSTAADGGYEILSGTSMATPHVSGAIALLHSIYPTKTAADYKNLLLVGAKPLNSLVGSSITEATLRLWGAGNTGSLNCNNQEFAKRIAPIGSNVAAINGSSFLLEVSLLNCDNSADQVIADMAGQAITLKDDGLLGDRLAGDGVLSREITVDWIGSRSISFPSAPLDSFQVTASVPPTINTVNYNYIEITGTALNLDDDEAAQIPIDFSPMAPAGTFDAVWVNSNGSISAAYFDNYDNKSLAAYTTKHIAYPWWDDIYPGATGNQYWQVVGSAPNRQLVIEWREVTQYYNVTPGDDYTVTFQAVLYESEAKIRFNYKDASASQLPFFQRGSGATVGYELDGIAAEFSHNQANLHDQLSIEIVAQNITDLSITQFQAVGLARPNSLQTITFTASDKNNASIIKEVDFHDGNGFTLINNDTFTKRYPLAGNYLLTARATTQDEQIYQPLSIHIQDFSADELALIAEIQAEADRYGLIDPDQLATTPELYGYIALNDVPLLDPSLVTNAPSGLHLWATPHSIYNLNSYFSSVRFIWIYQNQTFKGWSPDANKRQQIINSGYELITTIPSGSGVWVSK